MLRADAIVAEARRWVGTPWRHQASVKGVGCDCAGLVRGVALNLGLADLDEAHPEAERFLNYSRNPQPRKMLGALNHFMHRVRPDAMQAGDVLLMRFDRDPQHLAILTDAGTIVHAASAYGAVAEHRLSSDWRARVTGVWRFRG